MCVASPLRRVHSEMSLIFTIAGSTHQNMEEFRGYSLNFATT